MINSVDTSKVFKELVHCFTCDECFYFSLWAIAKYPKLPCPQCGININLADPPYQQLVVGVKERMAEINLFQCSPTHRYLDGVLVSCCRGTDRKLEPVVSVSVAPLANGSRHRRGAWVSPEPANAASR